MFFLVALTIWIAMNAYVIWRIGAVPAVRARVSRGILVAAGVLMATSYIAARAIEGRTASGLAVALEWIGAEWIGFVFLALVCFAAGDAVAMATKRRDLVRTAALLTAIALAVIATINAMRAPVIRQYEVRLRDLPPERDGMSVVAISDLHLGTLVSDRWLTARIDQVNALHPDLIAILGDLTEGDAPAERELPPVLARLRAPLGVWAVPGNHEAHGAGASDALLARAGVRLLRDASALAAPGIVIAGVDSAGHQRVAGRGLVTRALSGRIEPAATILLSHAPEQMSAAARSGAGLMLAGHTHGGQIWPFDLFVRMQYRTIGGRYDVDGMPLIVCRGTGTWGPAMRLWRPNEIVRVVLRRG